MLTSSIQIWKESLKSGQERLENDFFLHKNTDKLLKGHAKLIDSLLVDVWQAADISQDISLIAVGGYGRGTLFPYSDIDLLILVPESLPETQNESLTQLIGVFWDLGLNIGHSVRSLSDCVKEASKDTTIQTNLLEARFISGDKQYYKQFVAAVQSKLEPNAFLEAKVEEQQNRHKKHNDTGYNLEPNVKESPGALRDLHSILWIAQSQGLGSDWRALRSSGVISQHELLAILKHERWLNTLRIRLHLKSKRNEDRLLFDFQNELAKDLGYISNGKKRASEQLMQAYYRSVKYISLINEIVIKSLTNRLSKQSASISLSDDLMIQNGLLETTNDDLFTNDPRMLLAIFLHFQQHSAINGFGPTLLRLIQSSNKLINKAFRQVHLHQDLFIEILKQPTRVHQSMRLMNRYGVLGRYIPAFGRIVGQMQHDLFHVYTVDEHTLNVLGNLRRFSRPEFNHEFPLCSELFANFDETYLISLAAIFHDIAKGRGGDHSSLGSKDAERFCKIHRLSDEDSELVAWLVESHLQHSKVAQKNDLSDPAVIEDYANFVKDKRHLIALYLLTVSDVRGTSPAVWNDWKAELLRTLFIKTRDVLNNPAFTVNQCIQERQRKAGIKLKKFGLSEDAYQDLWRNVGRAYFSRFTSDEITWHSRLLTPHVFTDVPIVRAQLSRHGDGIQVMIYTRIKDDLFAQICNFFDRLGYSVVEAKIYTTDHQYALNNFIVLDESSNQISYNGLLSYIEENLAPQLQEDVQLEPPIKGRVGRQVKHMPIGTGVDIEPMDESTHHTVTITLGDKPGLLASIARLFLEHHIEVYNAKINTLGNRAEDTFVISGEDDRKLTHAEISTLKEALLKL